MKRQGRSGILRFLNRQKIFLGIALMLLILGLLNPRFVSYSNLVNILFQISINGIIAIGMTMLMIGKELDLSVGANMALVGTCLILLQPCGLAVAIASSVVVGVLVGLVNGLLVTKLKLDSLPATLGMMIAIRGLVLLLTNTQTIKGENSAFMLLANGSVLTIPYVVIIYAILLILSIFFLDRTIFGRNVYAIGGNQVASRYFGIPVERIKLICFMITGLLVGFAGVIITSRLNVASAIIGNDTPLDIITAVLLGGTSLMGGAGSSFKTFQGILFLGILANSMRLFGIPPSTQILIRGLMLVFIVTLDSYYVKKAKYR